MKTTLAIASLLLCACHDGDSGQDGGAGDAGADLASTVVFDLSTTDASPITAPDHTWTWIDLPGNVCDEGSTTGIGVNFGASDKLIVYFEGGGACGDYASCYQANSASHGPFGATQFNSRLSGLTPGSFFDRSDANNPFADWSQIYIPYCTGDVHAGDKIVTYSLGTDVRMFHHVGHTNAMNALDRIAATWPTLKKLVVTGASAGGYGSTINYASFRARWPGTSAYLIDDSGPLLDNGVTPQYLREWYVAWGVFDWVGSMCPACASNVNTLYGDLHALFPGDHFALLSSEQDKTIRAFYSMTGPDFQTALLALAADVLDPLPRFRHFFVTGDTHTMLGHPKDFSTGGVDLWTWMTRMVSDDPAWADAAP